jgi:hypothetical protein
MDLTNQSHRYPGGVQDGLRKEELSYLGVISQTSTSKKVNGGCFPQFIRLPFESH